MDFKELQIIFRQLLCNVVLSSADAKNYGLITHPPA